MNLEEKWKNLNGFLQWTIILSFFLLVGGILLNFMIMILFEDTTGQYLVGQRFFAFQNFWTEWEDVPQRLRDYRAPRDMLYLGFILTLFVGGLSCIGN